MVRACTPTFCSRSAKAMMNGRWSAFGIDSDASIIVSVSHPRRVFTVTGVLTALTTCCVMSNINGTFLSIPAPARSEEHTSELQSRQYLVCRLLLEKKKTKNKVNTYMT